MALPATPDESEERRRQAAIGCPFFWLLFFGQAKKSASAVGPSTHSQMNPREAKPFIRWVTAKGLTHPLIAQSSPKFLVSRGPLWPHETWAPSKT
jgi:hypothetical protein